MSFIFQIFVKGKEFETIEMKQISTKKRYICKKIFMACLVGIDYGTKRTGLACTDPNQLIASGLKNLPTSEVIPFLKAYCDQEKVAGFVVGKPLQKDGTPCASRNPDQCFCDVSRASFPRL
jgi:putative Holliday junction resolvase